MTRSLLPALSLAHVSVRHLAPPAFIRLAAEGGFDHVGLRLLPARPEEHKLAFGIGSPLHRETRQALRDHGVALLDIELIWLHAELDANEHLDTLEAAATLGARHLLVASREAPSERLTAAFTRLCEVAAKFSLTVQLEFLPWTAMDTLDSALKTVSAAGCSNGRVMLDALHLYRSRASFADMARVPPALVAYAQICDAPLARPADAEALADEAKFRRLLPGEGELPLAEFVDHLPAGTPLSVEVPHEAALQTSSPLAWVRRAWTTTLSLLEGKPRVGV